MPIVKYKNKKGKQVAKTLPYTKKGKAAAAKLAKAKGVTMRKKY
jgi:hypothetical protein